METRKYVSIDCIHALYIFNKHQSLLASFNFFCVYSFSLWRPQLLHPLYINSCLWKFFIDETGNVAPILMA